jgi:hypothetical protein
MNDAVHALVIRGSCMVCIDRTRVFKPLPYMLVEHQFPPALSFAVIVGKITADDIVLLDVDETIMVRHMGIPSASNSLVHLHAILCTAKYVMFVTARPPSMASWLHLKNDLANLGIAADREHCLFTGDVNKGRYVRTALIGRGLGDMPGWFIDDNRLALRSVAQFVPHLRCLEFMGRCGAKPPCPPDPIVVLKPLPPMIHPDFEAGEVQVKPAFERVRKFLSLAFSNKRKRR